MPTIQAEQFHWADPILQPTVNQRSLQRWVGRQSDLHPCELGCQAEPSRLLPRRYQR